MPAPRVLKTSVIRRYPNIKFGKPLIAQLDFADGRRIQRVFAGQGDSGQSLIIARNSAGPRPTLDFVVTMGQGRPAVAARKYLRQRGEAFLRTPIDNHQGITTEGAAGVIETNESVETACGREAEEEAGAQGRSFLIGPPTYPGPALHSLEQHWASVTALAALKLSDTAGDGTGGEVGMYPTVTNYNGLRQLFQQGSSPLDQYVWQAMRLRFALSLNPKAPQIDWSTNARLSIPQGISAFVRFNRQVEEELLEPENADPVAIRTYEYSVMVPSADGQRIENKLMPFHGMVLAPLAAKDSLAVFAHYVDQASGRTHVILPKASLQPIYYVRQAEADRLQGTRASYGEFQEKPVFAAGLNLPFTDDKIKAVNSGLTSVVSCARQLMQSVIGQKAAVSAFYESRLAPTFPTHGWNTGVLHPMSIEIKDPNKVHLGADYEAVEMPAAFERIARGDLSDRTFEAMGLEHARANQIELPDYLGIDTRPILEALGF